MELPRIQQIVEELDNPDLRIVALEVNNDRSGARQFIEENNLTFTFGAVDRRFVKMYFNTGGYPNSFIINRNLEIVDHKLGFKAGDEAAVKEKLQSILATEDE